MCGRPVAVLGGTFDPPHYGHLAAVEQARQALAAEEAWLIPAGIPPHRKGTAASAGSRLAMLRAAVAGRPPLRVVDIEVRRPRPSYTIDTVSLLAREFPGVEPWLVLGADEARAILSWRDPERLLATARFAIVNRTGVEAVDEAEARSLGYDSDRTRLIRIDSPAISGREIRRRLAAGESVDDVVPPGVLELIRRFSLYPSPAPSSGRARR